MTVPTLEYKAVAPLTPSWGISPDDEEGTFCALVAVTGVRDNVNDIIVPGAVKGTLVERTPKGVHSHDDQQWTARTIAAEEWLPRDSRLPEKTRDGKPWPREAGAVFIKGQFNLNTPEGRTAYENVKFFKQQCEWSIGYAVIPGRSKRDSKGVRHIYELALYEYSTVLVAANPLAMTLSVKSQFERGATIEMTPGEPGPAPEPAEKPDGPYVIHIEMPEGADAQEIGRKAADLLLAHGIGGRLVKADPAPAQSHTHGGDGRPSVMLALMLSPEVAEQVTVKGGLPAEEMHITLAYLGKGLTPEQLTAVEVAAAEAAASGEPLSGSIGGLGAFPAGEDGVPAWAPVDVPGLEVLRQRVVDTLRQAGVPVAVNHGYTPHVTRAYLAEGDPLPDPLPPVPVEFTAMSLVVGGVSTPIPLGGAELDDVDEDDDDEEEAEAEADDRAGAETKDAGVDVLRAAGAPAPLPYEEISDRVRTAMRRWLHDDGVAAEDQWVYTAATFPSVAVVTAEQHDSTQAWQVPYTITAAGAVELGEPQQVEIDVALPGADRSAAVETVLGDTATAIKSLLAAGGGEVKAGQVLSGANSRRLLAAYTAIGEVLKSGGVNPDPEPDSDLGEAEPMPPEAPIQPDSTAPSALPTGVKAQPQEDMVTLTAAELFEGLALVAAIVDEQVS